MGVVNLLFGRPLASSEDQGERITPSQGVPTFGLDALSSAAYGPEAALTILLPLGLAGVHYIAPSDRRHHRSAADRLLQLSADDCGVSGRWRLLHGGQRKPGPRRRVAGSGGADDRLSAERGRGNFRRDRSPGFSRALAAEIHPADVSGGVGSPDHREPARSSRSRIRVYRAHLPFCRHPGRGDRNRHFPGDHDGRTSPRLVAAPACAGCGRRGPWDSGCC